jgi:hypothetical protein
VVVAVISSVSSNYGNQNLLAVKGSKRTRNGTHGEKEETMTIVVCMSASGSNWVLPMFLSKGKYRRV